MATSTILQSITQSGALNSYIPTPQDGKFATDLYIALQNHADLTPLQQAFIASTTLPLPFSWKLAFFGFLDGLSQQPLPILNILGLIVLFIIGWQIGRLIFRSLLAKKDPLVFLELTFPSSTTKTAYSTEQLFTLLHTLAGQRRLAHRFLGYKKRYSLEIVASKEDGIRYVLGVARSEAEIIQKSLLSYLSGLKVKEINDYLPSDLTGKKRDEKNRSRVVELALSNNLVLPLQEQKTLSEHDPIAYLTGNMTKLQPDELIVFQTIITPLTKSGNRSVLRHINRIQRRIYANQALADTLFGSPWRRILAIPWALFKIALWVTELTIKFVLSMLIAFWDTSGDNLPIMERTADKNDKEEILNPYEQELQSTVKSKIDQPLFEASLRLLVRADTKQYRLRTNGFLAALGSLGSPYQSLILKGKGLLSFILRPISAIATRRLSLGNNSILSVSELTDIYHFPHTDTTKTEDMVKIKSPQLPAPLSFKQSATMLDNIFAKNSYGGSETAIGQTLRERQRHTYILGATGSGKTNLLSNMIYQDIVNGKGVAVLDPHGQLVESLLRVIPKERIKDVVWFAPDDDAYPIALNLMELPKAEDGQFSASQLQKQKSLVCSSIISIIEKFYDAKFFGPRMEYVLRNTILTALETPNPTLQTILDLLTKSTYRKEVVRGLKNKVLQDYWIFEFEKLGSLQKSSVISPITNKIGGLLSSPINYQILVQEKSKIDFDEIMNSGKILLCDLSKGKIGEDESSFFGSLIIAKIQLAALKRALVPESERRDFFMYVDEFQNFATGTFSELVSEARKYHLATILAHQSISQIENRDIIKVILANVGTIICFKTANPEDEQFILPIFSPEVSKHEIANLPLYNFYMKVSVGQAEDAFLAEADNFSAEGSDETAHAVIDESRKQHATKANPQKEVEAETKPVTPKKRASKPRPKVETQKTGLLP